MLAESKGVAMKEVMGEIFRDKYMVYTVVTTVFLISILVGVNLLFT